MTSQEKIQVLKMLEEGKINAEEAAKLIEALNYGGIDAFIGENAERLKALFAEVKVRAGEFAKKVEPAVNDAKGKLEEAYKKAEPTLKEAGKKFIGVTADFFSKVAKRIKESDKKEENTEANKEEF